MDRRFDLAAAAAFMALGLFVIYQATAIKSGMVRDPLGPRAAFYMTGGIMAVGGLILIIRSLRAWGKTSSNLMPNEGVEDEPGYPSSAVRAFVLIGACLLYGLLFDALGYLLATPPFVAAALLVLGERKWLPIATIAILFTVINYVVFAQGLGVRIPVGPLTGTFRALGLINL
jgi:putative tricarboxylic transport membrane protein